LNRQAGSVSDRSFFNHAVRTMVRVALITGASRGIGAATTWRLARQAYRAVVNHRASAPQAEEVVATIAAAAGEAVTIKADVNVPENVTAIVDEIVVADNSDGSPTDPARPGQARNKPRERQHRILSVALTPDKQPESSPEAPAFVRQGARSRSPDPSAVRPADSSRRPPRPAAAA
jgi:hypothetical protein